jgi:hypothetical protein
MTAIHKRHATDGIRSFVVAVSDRRTFSDKLVLRVCLTVVSVDEAPRSLINATVRDRRYIK